MPPKRLRERLEELYQKRQKVLSTAENDDWFPVVDLDQYSYDFKEMDPAVSKLTFTEFNPVSLCDIFCNKHQQGGGRNLRTAIKEALAHFDTLLPGQQQQDCQRNQKLISGFLITHEHLDSVSKNFRSIVKEVGEYAEGHVVHETGDIVKYPSKPGHDKWFYELMAELGNHKPYLLDLKSQLNHKDDKTIPMASMVQRWAGVCIEKGKPKIIAFDKHYLCDLLN
eukprot:gene1930-2108_t